MSFPLISPQASDLKPANIAQVVVAGLLPFALAGCSSPKLAAAPAEPMLFWAMEYTVHTGESDRMAQTYGWRYAPVVKERVEAYLSEGDRAQRYCHADPHRDHQRPTPCRDFFIVVNIGGNKARGYGRSFKETGISCREDAGIWQVLES